MESRIPSLAQVRALYDDGLYLQAYLASGGSRSALVNWRGTQERLYAGRLAANLGAHRLSNILHTLSWRTDRTNPEARSAYARVLQEERGPLYAWRWMQQIWNPLNPDITHTEWLATAAIMLGDMRDFERAHSLINRALEHQTDEYWVHTVHSRILEKEDRYAEAMEAVDRALELKPGNRVGVQVKAHLLTIANRPDDAFALLTEAESKLESSAITAQCAMLLQERADWEALSNCIPRLEQLTPLIEPPLVEWINGLRGDVAYHQGDLEQAKLYLGKSGGFDKKIAEKLARDRPAKRVQLEVKFVRQNHVTCAPATLTALSQYWGRTAEHLDVVEEICYDGTPGHSERHWADTHGFVTREFTLTVSAAQALLDRGVPFTLATSGLNMGHLQAVIGYDDRRGTLLIRDPYYPHTAEALAEELVESQRSTGPRGHAFVPIGQAGLLDNIELPDAALWDTHHRLLQALQTHRREDAVAELAALTEAAPEHHLTFSARRAMASYDSDLEGVLASVESMLTLYPDDPHLQGTRLSCLRDLSRPEERLAELKRLADDPEKPGRLLFARQYIRELLADARQHPEALTRLKQILKRMPDADALQAEAIIWATRRRFPQALECYRLAACLEDKSEFYAHSYTETLRVQGRSEEALAFLRTRYQELGARSSLPARTLFHTLQESGKLTEALELLDEALHRRPEDGDLLTFAAIEWARVGRFSEADALLERATGRVAETTLWHSQAAVAYYKGDRSEELALAQKLVEREPLNMNAHQALARALSALEGAEAVDVHFARMQERFPHNVNLRHARIEWQRELGDPTRLDAALKEVIAIWPHDAWARRERALQLARSGRGAEALAEIDEACKLQPSHTAGHAIRGYVLRELDRSAEAQQAYGLSLQLDADQPHALSALIDSAPTRESRRSLLAWYEREIIRQAAPDSGVFAFRQTAANYLHPDELGAALLRLQTARPDLWQCASARIDFLTEQGQLDEALTEGERAVERFPLQPRLTLDLADTLAARGELARAIAVLQELLERYPLYTGLIHQLCHLLGVQKRTAEVRATLEKALEASPLNVGLHQALADALYNAGQKEAALERLRIAIERDPQEQSLWERLKTWTAALGRREDAVALVRTLVARRPDDALLRLAAARALPGDALAERLELVEAAIRLMPRSADAYDLKAELLAQAGRWDDARAACAPKAFAKVPLFLRGRAAWIEAVRGDLKKAIQLMRVVVTEDSSYFWGWDNLMEWYYDLEDYPGLTEAARWSTRLAPDSPRGWAYLGEARLKQKDRAGAKEAFREAVRRAPGYEYAANRLLYLQLEDNELDAFEQTLAQLAPSLASEPGVLQQAVSAAAKRKNGALALERFDALLAAAMEADYPTYLRHAIKGLEDPAWQDEALARLKAALALPETPAPLGMEWGTGMFQRDRGVEAVGDMPAFAGGTDAQRMAAAQVIAEFAEKGDGARAQALFKQFAPSLRRTDKAWGTLAHALSVTFDWEKLAEWTNDWQTHSDLEPWMLFNRVEALRCLGNFPESTKVSQAALSLPPDYTTSWHALVLAFEIAIAGGDPGPLLADFSLDPDKLAPHPKQLLLLVRAIRLARTDFTQAKKLAESAKAAWPQARTYPGGRRWINDAIQQIAKQAGGPLAWVWAKSSSV